MFLNHQILSKTAVIAASSTMDFQTSVREIFTDAQRSMQARTKLISRLKKVADGFGDEETFFEVFSSLVKHSLVVFTREPAVERTIEFVVAFATAEGKAGPKEITKKQAS